MSFLPQLGPYVYLNTLTEIDKNYANRARAYSTVNLNNSFKKENGSTIMPIQNAINQLKTIAAAQAQLEHQAIHNYLVKINRYLQDKTLPPEIKRNLREQQRNIQNLDFANFKTNQTQLIQAMNLISQNIDMYSRRLNEIANPLETYVGMNRRFEMDIQPRVEEFFMHEGKTTKGSRINKSQALHKSIEKTINDKLDKELSDFPKELIQELKALIFIDFNNWIENQDISFYDINEDDATVLYYQYMKLQENALQETHLQRIMNTHQNELEKLAREMKSILHTDFITEEEKKELKDAINKQQKTHTFKEQQLTLSQMKKIIKTYDYNIIKNEDKHFVFTLHTRTSHGNFYEQVLRILMSATNIEGNVAADLIVPIGNVTFTIEEQEIQNELLKLTDNLGTILTQDFNKQETMTIENFDKYVNQQRTLHTTLNEKINNTKQIIEEISSTNDDFFIAHESLKLYKSAENKNSNFEAFHGREMNAMSSLTKLYASTNLSTNMIDPKQLITYLINIDPSTLAGNLNKQPLETYFSLFAGLLMFDDVKEIADLSLQSIQQNVNTNAINQLHIYNIGGIYYPISIILNNLVTQMDDIVQNLSINADKTAVATISGPVPVAPDNTTLSSWQDLANSTIQDTKIQIHFLAGFMQYITNLSNNFGA